DVPADERLLEAFGGVGSVHMFALGCAGELVADVGAGELLERGQPVDGVPSSGYGAALPAGLPAGGQFHVAHVLSCRDTHAVGADVEGVHDPHSRSVKVCADRRISGPMWPPRRSMRSAARVNVSATWSSRSSGGPSPGQPRRTWSRGINWLIDSSRAIVTPSMGLVVPRKD